jgi:predicted  nucleic acid-binding Zn-ribbon protein
MNDMLLQYLGGLIATSIVLFIASFNYVRSKQEKIHYQRERSLLPDAVRLEKLVDLRKNAEDEYDSIQERLADAKVLISERDEAHSWLSTNQDKLLQMKADREEQESMRKQLESLQGNIRDQQSIINSNQTSIATIRAELSYFEKLKEQKESEILAIENAKNTVNEQRLALEEQLEPMRIKLSGIESEIRTRADEYERQTQSMNDRRMVLQHELDQTLDLIKQNSAKLDLIRDKLNETNSNLAEKQGKIGVAKLDLESLELKKVKVLDSISRLEEQIAGLEKSKLQIKSDLQPLEVQLAGIQTKISNAAGELSDAKANMEKRIQQYESEITECKERFQLNEQKIAEIGVQLNDATNALHLARDERSRLSADVQALQREKVALEDLIKNLRADWNTVLQLSGRDEGAEERRTQELWQPYIKQKASDFSKRKGKSELDFLDDSENYLRSKKLYFPKRVLRAFHTSLKVTDISPLVVLAGISGTGKSELPRRYAEAMGLHFLNVAVQPRWDSPQDMFGFFNYLENRYRATELGRALVQMDPFYKEPNRGWMPPEDWDHSLSSQMLLVLLDEMNLARVEYYFSEFLSRLETRRGIARNDSESRRKAEIGLEVGSGKNKSPIMQLFVDRNVLFVGTMNEDETTQALSDKVIDRANVLRFGRPGRVGEFGGEKAIAALDSKLDFSVWNSWCKTDDNLPASERDRVLDAIDQLDKAMAEVKRPFGFRTRNSILSYVSNYPSQDNDAISDALADQIEQKILPKFRGLDSRDSAVKSSLSKIKSVLKELKDDLLFGAIEQSSRDGQFVWLGVNRFEEEYSEAR